MMRRLALERDRQPVLIRGIDLLAGAGCVVVTTERWSRATQTEGGHRRAAGPNRESCERRTVVGVKTEVVGGGRESALSERLVRGALAGIAGGVIFGAL